MRIRKHAKVSALFLSSSSLSSSDTLFSSHLCQLNQSPWDVITFLPSDSSPPPFQFDGNESFNGNGSLVDSIGAVESVGSMKLALEVEEMDRKNVDKREEKQVGANLCCKTDGKQWQCKRAAQKKNTMCEYHLAQIKNYNTLAHPSITKSSSNKPAQARKPSTASPSNANEFYYYSGFGPRWGKKRDIIRNSVAHKREKEAVEPVKVTVPLPCSLSTEIDDDDDDDDEEENCVNGKKRRRKPIKARSLKDLCQGMG